MNKKLVSVIMSVYNDERFVGQAIESVLGQSYGDFEFIITDDGSTDNTLQVMEKYASRDKRIKIIHQDNAGLTRSFNNMISNSSGAYIARQDSDDISDPLRFEKQVDFLNSNPEIMMVGTGSALIDESGEIIKYEMPLTGYERIIKRLENKNAFVHGSVMFNKKIFSDHNLYYEEFKYAEDYDLFLRISEKYAVDNIPGYLYHYRIRPNAISNKHLAGQLRMGVIVARSAQWRRKNKLQVLNKAVYERFARDTETLLSRRILACRVSLARGRNYLLLGKRWAAVYEFLKAFLYFPSPKAVYHACRAMITGRAA
ncbi:MAG: hypothetical protein A2293_06810 [Elusimicrobia bacterium RIFOXYB2_FULL_49_7]|nr:MAG: hypothetical protein A2293_06810 [Elusimicrobia bacterium RIFOXYB2_FULL_49_7]